MNTHPPLIAVSSYSHNTRAFELRLFNDCYDLVVFDLGTVIDRHSFPVSVANLALAILTGVLFLNPDQESVGSFRCASSVTRALSPMGGTSYVD